jgi:hypothetical protein
LGWVNVGCDHDTASFAIESIRRWWVQMGKPLYPRVRTLLICADSGGSNGYRVRLWKRELQKLADTIGLDITVCHLPPGTSKWNKIEHRLFSYITMNWRAQPLISHEVIVDLIGSTTPKAAYVSKPNSIPMSIRSRFKFLMRRWLLCALRHTIFMENGTTR